MKRYDVKLDEKTYQQAKDGAAKYGLSISSYIALAMSGLRISHIGVADQKKPAADTIDTDAELRESLGIRHS